MHVVCHKKNHAFVRDWSRGWNEDGALLNSLLASDVIEGLRLLDNLINTLIQKPRNLSTSLTSESNRHASTIFLL